MLRLALVPLLLVSFLSSAGAAWTEDKEYLYQELKWRSENPCYYPKEYYECILGRQPGTLNDIVAKKQAQECSSRHSCVRGKKGSEPDTKRFQLFGSTTPDECLKKYAKATASPYAVTQIRSACQALYVR